MSKIIGKKRFIIFIAAILIIIGGIIFGAYKYWQYIHKMPWEMSLPQAAEIGPKKNYQLLIKINNTNGGVVGGYQRGDIIMIEKEDKQWSIAEQEGFLIIKMSLTEAQTQLFVSSSNDTRQAFKNEIEGKMPSEVDKARRIAVDLAKLGISPNQQTGKVISDKIFKWNDIIIEKNN